MSETDIDDIGFAHRSPLELPPGERRRLRALAHPLHPVVSVGQHGLTPAVLHEIDVALAAHGLIKVRVFNDDRGEREALLADVCAKMGCAPVQHIGKLLILWRPKVEEPVEDRPRKAKAAKHPIARPSSATAKTSGARKLPGAKSRSGPKIGAAAGKATATTRRRTRDDEPAAGKPKVPRRARGQPLSTIDASGRPPRSPKAPRSSSPSPKSPRGHRHAETSDRGAGRGSGKPPRGAAPPAPGGSRRRSGGGPAGIPRAPNPRRRRTQSR
jgi:putative YhbY family RNA-binding protein